MADEMKDPKTILEEAIKERDALNVFIKLLQERMGLADQVEAVSGKPKPSTPSTAAGFDPLSVVFPGMFFGKSQTQAAKALLEVVRPRPLQTKVIAACLEKGGLKIGGKKPLVTLWGSLGRDEDFLLIPKAGWTLAAWHSPSVVAEHRKKRNKEGEESNGKDAEKD